MMDFHLDKNLILESNCDFKEAEFAILGVPFDSTSSYRPGSRFAPLWIRKEFLEISKPESFFKKKVYDLGNVNVVHGNLQETNRHIEETLQEAFNENPDFVPITLGGEHSISYSPIKVLHEKHKDLQIAHFDAHADLMDDYLGEKWSHATVMKRAQELPLGDKDSIKKAYDMGIDIVQFGVRVLDESEKELKKNLKNKLNPKEPTYISIDMDVLEPGLYPGVETPEPGGLTFQELMGLLKPINNVVGFDIVETNPLFDKGDVTSVAAAKIMLELMQESGKLFTVK
jgi:agmatinase